MYPKEIKMAGIAGHCLMFIFCPVSSRASLNILVENKHYFIPLDS